MSSFRHSALRNVQSARVLVLHPAISRDAPVECRLRAFKLSNPPRYEALSYTWDDQKPSRPIQYNGSKLLVTLNVEAALKQLRRGIFQRNVWVDAICIDQSNLDERSSQVPLMNKISHGATKS